MISIYILSIICIGLFFLLGIFLVTSKTKNSISSRMIGVFFILLGLNFLDGNLLLTGFYLNFPDLALWEEPFVFLYGPIIYFYSITITSDNFRFKIRHLIHTIPFIGLMLFILFQYQLKPISDKLLMLHSIVDFNQPKELLIPTILIFIHIVIYFLYSKKRIKSYREGLKAYFSTLNIDWLDKSLNFIFVLLAISFVNSFFQFLGDKYLFQIGLLVLIVFVLVFVGKVYFKVMEQPMLFVADKKQKNYLDPIDEEERLSIYSQLKKELEENQLFLNPELTIDDLAKLLNLNSKKTSRVINESFGHNFFDLINSYRIEYAKNVIKENKDSGQTILEVLYNSGFNSKSSFNTQFKKKTGLTPSEFKKLNS